VYGKKSDTILSHKMTGDVMPVLVHEGAAAPCGLTAGSPSLFGGDHADNLFACYFNLHKVVRHTLVPVGRRSRPSMRTSWPATIDFHPTDVFEDADDSLLVVHGAAVCCPTQPPSLTYRRVTACKVGENGRRSAQGRNCVETALPTSWPICLATNGTCSRAGNENAAEPG
jgi:hypothetical protein